MCWPLRGSRGTKYTKILKLIRVQKTPPKHGIGTSGMSTPHGICSGHEPTTVQDGENNDYCGRDRQENGGECGEIRAERARM
jgi:hypothetical protein